MSATRLIEPARVWLRRGSLDRSLAEGADPTVTPELARRARQLVSRRCRTGVAAGMRNLVDAAEESDRGLSAQVPLQRAEIRRERELILEIAADLESSDDVTPHGVALVERLLVEGDSPFYTPLRPGTLRISLRQARAALYLG